MNDDLISRQAAIKLLEDWADGYSYLEVPVSSIEPKLNELPSVKPTLYGYKIEHLAYIATVMQKEGVTAEYAVRTFDDMERVLKMLISEVQEKIEEALNG